MNKQINQNSGILFTMSGISKAKIISCYSWFNIFYFLNHAIIFTLALPAGVETKAPG